MQRVNTPVTTGRRSPPGQNTTRHSAHTSTPERGLFLNPNRRERVAPPATPPQPSRPHRPTVGVIAQTNTTRRPATVTTPLNVSTSSSSSDEENLSEARTRLLGLIQAAHRSQRAMLYEILGRIDDTIASLIRDSLGTCIF